MTKKELEKRTRIKNIQQRRGIVPKSLGGPGKDGVRPKRKTVEEKEAIQVAYQADKERRRLKREATKVHNKQKSQGK